ncbi:MAG TPA: ribokinase [Bacteroidales bacterium]|nr:ribokinase [Bacteroidales bacterium]
MKNILVIGSTNTDMVVKSPRFPKPGETILGGEFHLFPGGKGANQAVAAARLGGDVTFITKLGNDGFGNQAREGLARENICTDYILTDPATPSGVALITVNAEGENTIVVASGANDQLQSAEIRDMDIAFRKAEIVLLQLEIPMETVEQAILKAHDLGKKIILNPAPAQSIRPEILNRIFLLTPNETEAAILTGCAVTDLESAGIAAENLIRNGVKNVIITMGSSGAFFKNDTDEYLIPAFPVMPVDTTAAGDVFNGAIAVALAEGKNWPEAIRFANRAAAISVTRMGAQSSAPTAGELLLP